MTGYAIYSTLTRRVTWREVLNELQGPRPSAHQCETDVTTASRSGRSFENLCALPGSRGRARRASHGRSAFVNNFTADRKRARSGSAARESDRTKTLFFRFPCRHLCLRRGGWRVPHRGLRPRRHEPGSSRRDSGSIDDQHGAAGVLAGESNGPGQPAPDSSRAPAAWHHHLARDRNCGFVPVSTRAEFLDQKLGVYSRRHADLGPGGSPALARSAARRDPFTNYDRSGNRPICGAHRHDGFGDSLSEPGCAAYPGIAPWRCCTRHDGWPSLWTGRGKQEDKVAKTVTPLPARANEY